MIRNEREYKEAKRRLQEEKARRVTHAKKFESMGLAPEEIDRAMEPLLSFQEQLAEEIESYEKLKRGEFDPLINLRGLGYSLIALRISLGISQRELASALGVHESQVSRDERNEYHGITVERVTRVLEALGVRMESVFERPLTSPRGPDSGSGEESRVA